MLRSLITDARRFHPSLQSRHRGATHALFGLLLIAAGCAPTAESPAAAPAAAPAATSVTAAEETVEAEPSGVTDPGHDHGHDHGPVTGEGPTATPSANVIGAPLPPIAERPSGRIIDAHAHLSGWEVWPDVESVLDENNIDFIFNLSGGSPRRGQTLAMLLAEASGGRVLNLMNVDWEGIDEVAFGDVLAAELALLVNEYGYVGLKISKALGLYARDGRGELIAVDDPRLFPLWEMAGTLGVPVFIHTSDPAAFWEPVTPENERFAELNAHPSWSFADPEYPSRDALLEARDRVVARFPQTTFVGVHFANNPEDLAYVDRTLTRFPNFYVDLAARVPEIGRHDPAAVRAVFERHQDRILFATDIGIIRRRGQVSYTLGSSGETPATRSDVRPFYEAHERFLTTTDRGIAHPTPIQGAWTVDAIGLSPEVLDKVYYLNAYRLVLAGRRNQVEVHLAE